MIVFQLEFVGNDTNALLKNTAKTNCNEVLSKLYSNGVMLLVSEIWSGLFFCETCKPDHIP